MFKRIANRLLNNVERQVTNKAIEIMSPHIDDVVDGVINAVINQDEQVRTTGGATAKILEEIHKDFYDFHSSDADIAIQTFMMEFLAIKYEGKQNFEKANVSEKILLNIGPKSFSRISDIRINQIAISNYEKSQNSATITYRVSIGFNMGGTRREQLYEIRYTLQLRDEYEAAKFLKCDNCGAPLESTSGKCRYCGMKHLRDTIESWVVTSIIKK